MGLFEFYEAYFLQNPRFMTRPWGYFSCSSAQVAAVLGVMDFFQAGVVVDVGGGTGALFAAILVANPALRGIWFDLPYVVAHAKQVLGESGVTDRVEIRGGSIFKGVPSDGDTYLLKTVLHDWDDARAMAILQNCRTAMKSASRFLIVERELPQVGQPGRAAGSVFA